MKYHQVKAQDVKVGDRLDDDYTEGGVKITNISVAGNEFTFRYYDHNAVERGAVFNKGEMVRLVLPSVELVDVDRYNAYLNLCRHQGRVAMEYCDWVKTIGKIHTKSNKPALADKFPHYYPELPAGTTHMDVYRVLDAFKVKRSSIQHAIKKLLAAGLRGAKDEVKDLKEARDSIDRALEMIQEESHEDEQA